MTRPKWVTPARLAEARKAAVALVGALAEITALGLLHGTARDLAVVIVSGATAAGVYVAPNAAPADPAGPRP